MKDIGSEDRLACDDCSWVGPMSKAKTAPNPFNKRESGVFIPQQYQDSGWPLQVR